METHTRRIFSPFSGIGVGGVSPVLLHLLTLIVPINVYIVGPFLGTGIQWALFRYQETYLGRYLISFLTDYSYLTHGYLTGKTSLSIAMWILGSLVLLAAFLVALLWERGPSNRFRGIALVVGSVFFLISSFIQYGLLFHGPAGIGIPVGIPVLLMLGYLTLKAPGMQPSPDPAQVPSSNRWKDILLLFLTCFLMYNTVTYIRMSGDTSPARYVPMSILRYGEISCDHFAQYFTNPDNLYAYELVNGHYYSVFPMGMPILTTPLYVIPYLLSVLLQVPLNNYVIALMARFASATVAALSTVVVYRIGRELFTRGAALATALVYAFGTGTWAISSQAPWQEGMVELLLALMLLVILRNEAEESGRHLILLGIFSGLLAVTRPPAAILLIPIIYYAIRFFPRKAHLYGIPAVISASPFVMYNLLVFGSLFGGYDRTAALLGISPGVGIRFIGFLLAPNNGLFIFSPVLLVGLWGYLYTRDITKKNFREILVLYGPILVLTTLFFSFHPGWVGIAYGPRYLMVFLPVYILYLGAFVDRGLRTFSGWKRPLAFAGLALLTLISIGIQFIGALYYPFLTDVGMDENRAWNASDSLILRSYHDGSIQMKTISVNSLPPLPPFLHVNVQNGVVYPIASKSYG